MKKPYLDELEKLINENDFSFLKNKSILLTGASGLIGSYLIDTLMYANFKLKLNLLLYAVVRNEGRARKIFEKHLENDNFSLIVQDMTKDVNFNFKSDFIIHAASNANPKSFDEDPIGTIKSNVNGTLNLLNYARNHGSKLLYLSSSEVYGEPLVEGQIFKEGDLGLVNQLNPRSCYTESKRMAENICVNYFKQYGIHTNIVRIGFVYGPNFTEYDNRVIPQFMRNALNNEPIIMKSNGSLVRSYIYVYDVISAFIIILKNGVSPEVYNVSNNYSHVSIKDIANNISNISGVDLEYDLPEEEIKKGYSPFSAGLIDGSKLETIGWLPKYNLKEGLVKTYMHLKK